MLTTRLMMTRGRPLKQHYLVLGIAQGATAEETKKAYHSLTRVHHPVRPPALRLPPSSSCTKVRPVAAIASH